MDETSPTSANPQTWIALGIVFATASLFLINLLRRKKNGCGMGCGCKTDGKKG